MILSPRFPPPPPWKEDTRTSRDMADGSVSSAGVRGGASGASVDGGGACGVLRPHGAGAVRLYAKKVKS